MKVSQLKKQILVVQVNPRNVTLKQAEGEFVLFVDSDDYINKETLKDAAAFIDEHHSDGLLIKIERC